MRLFASLLSGKGAVYGGAAFLLGLVPPPFESVTRAETPPRITAIPGAARDEARDWVLTNQARRAVMKDDQLSSLNLGVSVRDRVATIWGTLPSAEVGKRAEEMLKKINGIASVVNECKIVPAANPVPQQVADAVKRLQGDEGVDSKPPSPPAATTGRQVVAKPAPEMLPPRPVHETHETRLPAIGPPAAVLLQPVFTSNVREAGFNSIEKARESEPRFKDLSLEVKGGVVKISGRVSSLKDALDLAEKLNAIPDVRQVILGNVQETR